MKLVKLTAEQASAQLGGTALQGRITISYREVIQKLGAPTFGARYGIDAEWVVQTPFGMCSLYNYKNGPNYLGNRVDLADIDEWSLNCHPGAEDAARELARQLGGVFRDRGDQIRKAYEPWNLKKTRRII